MKKDEFFEWIRRFDKNDQEKLSKLSNSLPQKSKLFIKKVIKRIKDSQLTDKKKDDASFGVLIENIKKKEGRAFTSGDISRAVNRLKDFIYDFIIKNEIKKNDLLKYKIIFNATKNKKFTDAHFYYLDNRESANEQQEARSFNYYQEKFEHNYFRYFNAEFEKHKFQTTKNYQDFDPEAVLHQSWQDLQQAFLIIQFRLACEIVYNRGALKTDTNILNNIDLNFLNQQLENTLLSGSTVLKIYANLYKWLNNNNLNNLKDLELILNQSLDNIKLFPNEEQVSLLILLINCLGKSTKKSPESERIFALIQKVGKFGFEQHIFGKESTVDENLFITIYDVCHYSNSPFCKKMKDSYIDYLPTEEDKEWVLSFINIRELAQEKKYYEALKILNNMKNHKNYRFATRRFVYLLQYSYELKCEIDKNPSTFSFNEEDIVNENSFSMLVNNINYNIENADYFQKPAEHEINNLKNFINIVSMLFYNKHTISEIENYMETHSTFSKPWFQKKIEYEKKRLENLKIASSR